MALPNRRAFDFQDRSRPATVYGVMMMIVPGDHSVPIDIERAPDSGGSPGTYVQIAGGYIAPKSGLLFTDFLPNDNQPRWYRARHGTGELYGSAGSYFTAFSATPRLLREDPLAIQSSIPGPFTRTEDLNLLSVTETRLADLSVATAKVQDEAVTTPKTLQDACKINRAITPQTIPDSTLTNVAFDSETFDDSGMFDAGTDGEVVVLPRDGKVVITGEVGFNAGGGTFRYVDILVDGTPVARAQVAPVSGALTSVSLTGIADASAADEVTMRVLQNSGGNLDIEEATISLSVHYVSG